MSRETSATGSRRNRHWCNVFRRGYGHVTGARNSVDTRARSRSKLGFIGFSISVLGEGVTSCLDRVVEEIIKLRPINHWHRGYITRVFRRGDTRRSDAIINKVRFRGKDAPSPVSRRRSTTAGYANEDTTNLNNYLLFLHRLGWRQRRLRRRRRLSRAAIYSRYINYDARGESRDVNYLARAPNIDSRMSGHGLARGACEKAGKDSRAGGKRSRGKSDGKEPAEERTKKRRRRREGGGGVREKRVKSGLAKHKLGITSQPEKERAGPISTH